jgi:hypothetical protein
MNEDVVTTDSFKVPTVMRYVRVQTILENEPAFKDQLGQKDKEVAKRNGQRHFFSKKVIDVTEAIHRAGLDAHNTDRGVVLRYAMGVFGMEQPNSSPQQPKNSLPVKLPPVPAPPAEVERNGKHKPDKEKTKTAPKKTKISDIKLAVRPVAKTEPEEPEPEEEEEVASPSRLESKPISYQVNTAIFTLLCAVMNLAERDGAPGADKRLQKVEALMDEYEKVKHHPSKSA